MSILFLSPKLTMSNTEEAEIFFHTCRDILDDCIVEVQKEFVQSWDKINSLQRLEAHPDDLFIFFNAENGVYKEEFLKLLEKYCRAQSQIWPVAFSRAPECRHPPAAASAYQSFDIPCWNEKRSPLSNNIRAIAHMFARKIVARELSPLYQDETLYFISHRRSDGEHIAEKLADQLSILTRQRRAYRDVVEVKVGDDAQAEIDEYLSQSDVVIFLQTKDAKDSEYILKELCYALVNDIPILWVQIDGAPPADLRILPGEQPALRYSSEEFDDPKRLIEIADEIEDDCFRLIMNSSNQISSYIEYLTQLKHEKKITLTRDEGAVLAYKVGYQTWTIYNTQSYLHYIQCFGRNPKPSDVQNSVEKAAKPEFQQGKDSIFLLSRHTGSITPIIDRKHGIIKDNYDNYIVNLENSIGTKHDQLGKRIVLSGAFPDCDEIYKNSMLEALSVYARKIIRDGYTLVFGAHPTFQKIIFEISALYAPNVRNCVEMHMDRAYADGYDIPDLQKKCKLVLADGLSEMRQNMICREKSELLICLGGKMKEDKSQQGVDIEVGLARSAGVPVVLVGTVGGRSSEYALELAQTGDWSSLNHFGKELNENLLYHMNHRLMISQIMGCLLDS